MKALFEYISRSSGASTPLARRFALTAALALLSPGVARAADVWQTAGTQDANGGHLALPANVVAYNGDRHIYEAHGTITNLGSANFHSGSNVVLAAGEPITLSHGFTAHQGAELIAMIDRNHNGISDFLESHDADEDGIFDALEYVLGSNPRVNSQRFERDRDGDGIPDAVADLSLLGTPSRMHPLGMTQAQASFGSGVEFVWGFNGKLASEYRQVVQSHSANVFDSTVLFSGTVSDDFSIEFGFTLSETETYYTVAGWSATSSSSACRKCWECLRTWPGASTGGPT